jgi:hypothetical protein
MKLFGKKEKVLDLTEKLNKRQQQIDDIREEQKQESQITPFSFFDNPVSATSTQTSGYNDDSTSDEKRKKLLKTLSDITTRLEDLSNQIYKLEQRVELLERKNNIY